MNPKPLLLRTSNSRLALRAPALFFAMAGLFLIFVPASAAQVKIVQLSDTHIGEQHSPHAAENLRRAVDMINRIYPDAVILSGDIGEGPDNWQIARKILKGLKAPLFYVPGNHDVHSRDVRRYRSVFGQDYYNFHVKYVNFLVIDSQLLGNFDEFQAHSPPPMPEETEEESRKMMNWLNGQARGRDHDHDNDADDRGDRDDRRRGGVTIAIQHIPAFRDGNFPPDTKPYWVISEPYRSRELDLLRRLGVHHVLAGHWHNARVFERDGITWHVAPATSWLPWGGELGFSVHTITKDGDVRTEFVPLHAQP
jgi:3',5'-cyclic AMP phosphodiesterase CpdA